MNLCFCGVQVAEVLVQALLQPAASNKVVEIVASPTAAATSPDSWFQAL
jgi:hypothetical protein